MSKRWLAWLGCGLIAAAHAAADKPLPIPPLTPDSTSMTLKGGSRSCIAHLAPASAKPTVQVVLLPDKQSGVIASAFIAPLILDFMEVKGQVLSLGLSPYPEKAADAKSVFPCLDQAFEALTKAGTLSNGTSPVLVAVGASASIALQYAASHPEVKAVALVSAPAIEKQDDVFKPLLGGGYQIVDLVASLDYPPIQKAANSRLTYENQSPANYRQITVTGADHRYAGFEDRVMEAIQALAKRAKTA